MSEKFAASFSSVMHGCYRRYVAIGARIGQGLGSYPKRAFSRRMLPPGGAAVAACRPELAAGH